MAIAFDATANSGLQTMTSPYSYNLTVAGDDRFLVVGVAFSGLGQSVTGITYNGVALTLIEAKNSATSRRAELWGLIAPATGTNSVTVTLSSAVTSISGAMSFTGVDQSTPNEADANASGAGTSDISVAVTTVADNDWVVDFASTGDTAATVGAGQTEKVNVADMMFGSGLMSYEGPKTPAGSVTMSWTDIGSLLEWATVATALIPVAAAPTPIPNKIYLADMGVARGSYF